jgi:putative ABC transport system permease protein
MFIQFLKAASKRIVHQKLYSAISVFSLAIGLAAVMLIYAFVRYESSFDGMHPQAERTYRLNWADESTGARFATFYNVLTPVLDEGLDEIESFARLARREHLLTANDVDQLATLTLVDTAFFDFFAYPALQGDAAIAIRDMNSARSSGPIRVRT